MSSYRITLIEHDGQQHELAAEEGQSIMQTALDNLVPGISGDCGGFCTCATCHGYVDPDWLQRLPPADEDELAMLEGSPYIKPNSRLTCQIKMREELNGIVVQLPESQY